MPTASSAKIAAAQVHSLSVLRRRRNGGAASNCDAPSSGSSAVGAGARSNGGGGTALVGQRRRGSASSAQARRRGSGCGTTKRGRLGRRRGGCVERAARGAGDGCGGGGGCGAALRRRRPARRAELGRVLEPAVPALGAAHRPAFGADRAVGHDVARRAGGAGDDHFAAKPRTRRRGQQGASPVMLRRPAAFFHIDQRL